MTPSDKALLNSLRAKVDEGGYDGWADDPLHIAAANRIEQLLNDLGTEQTMHAAWRKRAMESERPPPYVRPLRPIPPPPPPLPLLPPSDTDYSVPGVTAPENVIVTECGCLVPLIVGAGFILAMLAC